MLNHGLGCRLSANDPWPRILAPRLAEHHEGARQRSPGIGTTGMRQGQLSCAPTRTWIQGRSIQWKLRVLPLGQATDMLDSPPSIGWYGPQTSRIAAWPLASQAVRRTASPVPDKPSRGGSALTEATGRGESGAPEKKRSDPESVDGGQTSKPAAWSAGTRPRTCARRRIRRRSARRYLRDMRGICLRERPPEPPRLWRHPSVAAYPVALPIPPLLTGPPAHQSQSGCTQGVRPVVTSHLQRKPAHYCSAHPRIQ